MKKIVPRVHKDELWKGIIEELFEDFVYLFFPKFADEVDFTKPYEFLNKELQELIPASESQNRRADVLVKVFLKSGEEKWLLIHIEVQGYEDEHFPLRMYTYNYRTFDRYNKAVVALAILTDENPDFRPSCYESETWDTKIRYDFQMYKLLDYDESIFENSNNPFASVMQVARSFIRNKTLKTDDDLLSLKLELFRTMYSKGHRKEIIRKIANFIKLYVFFKNHDFFTKFESELDKITKYQPTMGLLELIKQRTIEEAERIGKEEGLEEGLEQGLEKGIEQGLEKGIEQGLEKGISAERRKTITKMLSKKFLVETIADILEISLLEVQSVQQEIAIKALFQENLDIEAISQHFEATEQTLLLSAQQIEIIFAEVQVERLLLDGLNVEAIVEKLGLPKTFVLKIEKSRQF